MPPPEFWLLSPIATLAAQRVVRLLIVDKLGRKLFTEPVFAWLLERLPPGRFWVAAGMFCAWCLGFWIHAAAVLTLWCAVAAGGWWLTAWILAGLALASHWVGTHVAGLLHEYDGDDEEDDGDGERE